MQIRKSKQPKIQQNKTTLVQLPLTTLGQETRWAYKLYDLHAIFYSRLSVSKSIFNVSLCYKFLLFLWRPLSCGGPLVVEALGNCPVCPLLNPVEVCLSVRDHIFRTARPSVSYGRGSVLLWWRSDRLRISGFMDDAIFAHMLRLLDVAGRLRQWGSHAALGLARRNTRCRQQTLGTTSCSQGLLRLYGRSGRVEYVLLFSRTWHTVVNWFSEKINKFDATRCQILRLKCTKFDFHWGSAETPPEELTALTQTSEL